MKIFILVETRIYCYDNIIDEIIGCYKTYKGVCTKLKDCINSENKTCNREVIDSKCYIAPLIKNADESWGRIKYKYGDKEYHIEVHELI